MAQPSPVDKYTLGYAAFGVILGLNNVGPWTALGIAIAWELLEDGARNMFPMAFPRFANESTLDRGADVAAVMAGYAAARALPSPQRQR